MHNYSQNESEAVTCLENPVILMIHPVAVFHH